MYVNELISAPHVITAGMLAAVLAAAYASYHLLIVWLGRRFVRRAVHPKDRSGGAGTMVYKWAAALKLVPAIGSRKYVEREQLLHGSGIATNPATYIAGRAILLACCCIALVHVHALGWSLDGVVMSSMTKTLISVVAVGLMAACFADKSILEVLMRQRRNKMLADICVIHRQLLYYAESSLNLHGKLVRCLPYAKSIRKELHLLTNEWYEHPDSAIRRLKTRLGSEEGYSFAETLQSLRLHEHERYYDLLRRRIADYKDKLELLKAGRKESMSYLLFVIAGIPIMYTFRLFMYPWVAEGQKLFETLG